MDEGVPSRKRKRSASAIGPYILRPLLEDVPLHADGEIGADIQITCVEYWEENLYVGTSAAELLHFVSIPSADYSQNSVFILASRLQPSPPPSTSSLPLPGVQQITLLPKVNKACILCNGVLTFYSLPELTPAFGNTKVSNCSWVGGVDLNSSNEEEVGVVVMVCMKNRVRLVRIGEEARSLKNIEYPGCLASSRRGGFACVADSHSYALLDVTNQQKVPLFPISSLDDTMEPIAAGQFEDISAAPDTPINQGLPSGHPGVDDNSAGAKGHGRSKSLGTLVGALGRRQPESRSRSPVTPSRPDSRSRVLSPSQATSPNRRAPHAGSPDREPNFPDKSLPPVPSGATTTKQLPPPPISQPPLLKPLVCSPLPSEFLLTTGTSTNEPGVGIFVNLDGDVVRGTLEFKRYPRALVIDGGLSMDASTTTNVEEYTDSYVLASMARFTEQGEESGIEIQRWDTEDTGRKDWLPVGVEHTNNDNDEEIKPSMVHVGLATTQTAVSIKFPEVGEKLRARRLKLQLVGGSLVGALEQSQAQKPSVYTKVEGTQTDSTDQLKNEGLDGAAGDQEVSRNKQEDEFGGRLGQRSSSAVTWTGNSIQWVVKNPLVLRLDAAIEQAMLVSEDIPLRRSKLVSIANSIRGQEAHSETEYLSLEYIRQKISLLLFATHLDSASTDPYDVTRQTTEELLTQGGTDPRVLLSMVPLLSREIIEGPNGIWIHAGITQLMRSDIILKQMSPSALISMDGLNMVKRFLMAWRERKGFGSVADEAEVFQSVDAALLHILLYQARRFSQDDSGRISSRRAELYSVVDHGVDCFNRAVVLLEGFRRLYVLSRLYQSRKMTRNVLATWRRIIDGEPDEGGELLDGENEVRKYLVRIKDFALIQEYGAWLARRNPTLGVEVFTDDHSRVKLEPSKVVDLLRREAPDAVKVFLEHLVFGKKNTQYANDLISYYLDNVLTVLESSKEARSTLAQSYETYRALHPPKPTYRQFIIDNAISASWWHDRLRLLELIGGSHGAGFTYDVEKVLQRIEPFEDSLVPESIILDGRQGRHQQALRLLTHGLGDYHTAINYCLLGGSSIFHPTSGPVDQQSIPTSEEQAKLFSYMFSEFLHIEDIGDRVERTSELLDRFGAWFDASYVLDRIPDSWSVELLSGFLISAFRRLVQERNEAMIAKALSGAENLQISADFVEKCEEMGPRVETAAVINV